MSKTNQWLFAILTVLMALPWSFSCKSQGFELENNVVIELCTVKQNTEETLSFMFPPSHHSIEVTLSPKYNGMHCGLIEYSVLQKNVYKVLIKTKDPNLETVLARVGQDNVFKKATFEKGVATVKLKI